jgi:hypothetical protein
VLGSLAGAAVGSVFPRDRPPPARKPGPVVLRAGEVGESEERVAIKRWVNAIYWSATIVVAVLGMWVGDVHLQKTKGGIGFLAFTLFFGLPALQLGGNLASAGVIALVLGLRREPRAWRRLGWITLGTVVGGLIGILLPLMLLFLFTMGRG